MMLHIASPFQRRDEKIAWIELNTMHGNIIIQPAHAPMIVTLRPQMNVTFRLRTGKEETITISNGLAHITRTDVTLLITS